MSYIQKSKSAQVLQYSKSATHKRITYIELSNKSSMSLLSIKYPSKKTSTKRIQYDLRKLNKD